MVRTVISRHMGPDMCASESPVAVPACWALSFLLDGKLPLPLSFLALSLAWLPWGWIWGLVWLPLSLRQWEARASRTNAIEAMAPSSTFELRCSFLSPSTVYFLHAQMVGTHNSEVWICQCRMGKTWVRRSSRQEGEANTSVFLSLMVSLQGLFRGSLYELASRCIFS